MCDLPVSKIFYATGPVPQPQQAAPEQQTAQVAKKIQNVQYAPVAPSTKITQPAACKDFSIFLASSIMLPVPRTDSNIVLASGPIPQQLVHEQQLVKKPEIAKKPQIIKKARIAHESQLVQNAAVAPSAEITQPAACKDFSIFVASSIMASIQAQSNSGQDSKEDNAKTQGLQQSHEPASESSSFTTITIE
ncbi:uncharacterized protein [Amphiura filiformis]|uniref:uncharacterized protein n=1 Tax=Amphiura filiformis TaxID=82378 RepID=UPI003B217F31